jgi:hypothetical protein
MGGQWLLSVTARQRRRRPSLIDPYERYVLNWWQKGNRNGTQLYRELTAQGYKGSSRAMYSYLATLRIPQVRSSKLSPSKPQGRKHTPSLPAPLENFSAQRASLSVYLSAREVRREAARRAGTDQAGQSKRRGRLLLDTNIHADDPRAYRTAVGHLAQRGRSESLARARVICQRHSPRQNGCAYRLDVALE